MNTEKIKLIGLAAAFKGGEVLRNHFGKLKHIRKKGAIDLVTEADVASEKVIIETIREAFPEHSILAEESGFQQGSDSDHWVIDPLDGTTNFAHQLGLFSVSIAFVSGKDILFGIVFNPISNELFMAQKGRGAMLNTTPIKVSEIDTVSESLLVTGFPYNHQEILDQLMGRFNRCLAASQGMRRLGSAALDLCFVACGRFDAFWEQNLKPWDTAAGTLIAREAGARVTDFSGIDYSPEKKEILATNEIIHEEMLSLLTERRKVYE